MDLKRTRVILSAVLLSLVAIATTASAADEDGDGVDDFVEKRLCDSAAKRELINDNAGAAGQCSAWDDFTPSGDVSAIISAQKNVTEDPTKAPEESCGLLDRFAGRDCSGFGNLLGPVWGVTDTVNATVDLQKVHDLLCSLETDSEIDGRCEVVDGNETYILPTLSNLTNGIRDATGPAPVVCHGAADPVTVVTDSANDADCDGRSNGEETAEASSDPAGFLAAPRCDNPLLYENETTDCSKLVDPEDYLPGDDGPYPCIVGQNDPNALVIQVRDNVDCDSRSNQEEVGAIIADPAAFAADPTKNNPLVPE